MAADVTVVVPWRDSGCEYRRRNLRELQAWLEPLGWPIILADSTAKDFNRSEARNNGVKKAQTPIVVLHDADLHIELQALRETVAMVRRYGGMRHPYRICRYLDEDNTQLLLKGRTPRQILRATRDAPGGAAVIRREDYLSIGGYDESYTGWGFEDLDFGARCKAAIGQTWGRTYGYHLWHPEAPRDELTLANRDRFSHIAYPTTRQMREGVTDVVYRVRPGDNNEELRFSLRSLVHLPHRKVWLVGHKPAWVNNVEHIPGNLHAGKWANVFDNLRIACRHRGITDPFVLFDDDMYLTENIDEIPSHYRGPLAAQVNPQRRSAWDESLQHTLDYLTAQGHADPISYELHIPYLVHKAQMLQALDEAADWSWPNPPQWRTLDGNRWQRGGTQAADVKIRNRNTPTDTWVLSSSGPSFNTIRPQLERQFPAPCRYER